MGRAHEIDRVAVGVLAVVFLLAYLVSCNLKVMDFQYYVYGIGFSSFPLSVIDVAHHAFGFLPDIAVYACIASALVAPVLYAVLILILAIFPRLSSSRCVLGVVARIRQFATQD